MRLSLRSPVTLNYQLIVASKPSNAKYKFVNKIVQIRDDNFPFNHPERGGGLCCRLGAHSRCYHCLDPIPPTEGGARKLSKHSSIETAVK